MSDDRKKFSTPDEARQKALRRKIRTWSGCALGAGALAWGVIDGGTMYFVLAALGFGLIEPTEFAKAFRR